ncbi:MAG: GDSL-type esterase/lipase family protein [Gordonia sp. (in: high G+C Gram-positive bacteria)]|uniref:GDSL-type esterase/lipase family protein n=1 Tax=Gordonia sp. (in: high G+C Gram-positive bacteria) TaxID=84139 RepID=UPI003BB7DD3A
MSAGVATADDEPDLAGSAACESVVHIGDSLSVSADDPAVVGEDGRLSTLYRQAGPQEVSIDAANGRTVIETDMASAGVDALKAVIDTADCVVVALGTNDASRIAAGSTLTADQRIDEIMAVAGGKRVLWPTVKTTSSAAESYKPEAMLAFTDALLRAVQRYGNLAVYRWDQAVGDELFTDDGIHLTDEGTKARNEGIATALHEVELAATTSVEDAG